MTGYEEAEISKLHIPLTLLKGEFIMSLEEIEKALESENWRIRRKAVKAFEDQEIPMDWIERALTDEDWHVRAGAVKAFKGREVPMKWIQGALTDEDQYVVDEAIILILNYFENQKTISF